MLYTRSGFFYRLIDFFSKYEVSFEPEQSLSVLMNPNGNPKVLGFFINFE
jgi:hypothetical protein